MHDNVGSKVERPAEHGRGKGIVHNQRNAVSVGKSRKAFNVQNIHGGIGQCFAENEFGIGADGLVEFFVRGVLINKSDLNAQAFQCHGKKIEGAAVDAG